MTTIELGQRRRRWLLLAGGVVAVWVVAAVLLGGDGAGDGGSAPSTTTTTAPAITTTVAPTSTSVVEGGPSLDVPATWELLLTGSGEGVRSVSLVTGVARPMPFAFLREARPDGVFVADADGLVWRPWPLDDASAVRLGVGDIGDGEVHTVPGEPLAWVVPEAGPALLLSLDDGAVLGDVPIPRGAWVLGAAPAGLVVGAGGDTFVLAPGGEVRRIEGQPWAVTGDAVALSRCRGADGTVDCGAELVALADGAELGPVAAPEPQITRFVSATHPSGWPTASVDGRFAVLRPDGWVPVAPEGIPTSSATVAWTPDGRFLLVREADVVHVVDAFADGGPVEVDAFRVDAAVAEMHVVAPPL